MVVGLCGNPASTMGFYMNDSEMYFCLASDGLVYILGNHGDFEAAEDTATGLGLDVIWMFGEETARSWRDTLISHESTI
jgi:hypothetical protein